MGVISIRMDDGLISRLKEKAGHGNVNGVVVDLIQVWLGEVKVIDANTPLNNERAYAPKPLADIKPEVKVRPPELEAKIQRILAYLENLPPNATEEGQPEDLKGYLCGAMTGAGQCSKPAWKWLGDAARCREH